MYSLVQLTINEWLKITKKRSFIINLILIAVLAVGIALFINKVVGNDFITSGEFGSILITMSGGGFVYLVLCLVQAASMVSKEHQQGTIKLLLIRAHTRHTILASKFIALILYMILVGLYIIIVSYIVGLLFFYNSDGLLITETLTQFGYSLLYVFAYMTIAFMLSTLLKSTAGTIAIALSLKILEGFIVMLLSRYEFSKFILFFNLDFSQFTDGASSIEGITPVFSAIIYTAYMLLFISITFIVFKKRDVA